MLVLVATREMQGATISDRHFAVEGELVTPVVLDCPDLECDVCARAWFGLASLGGTTTAMVVDRPGVTAAELRQSIHDWLDEQGIVDVVVQASEAGEYEVDGYRVTDPVAAVRDLVDAHVAEIDEICANFAEGTVVSRLGNLVSPRVMRLAA